MTDREEIAARDHDALLDKLARVISGGAPFPSRRSIEKARTILALLPALDASSAPAGDGCPAAGFTYVGTPYTRFPGGRDEAARLAAFYAALLMKRGLKVFSPIAHSHAVARVGELDETDHDLWVVADEPFVFAASDLIVVMMEGWSESRGLQHEIKAFSNAGKPVRYIHPADLEAPAAPRPDEAG